MAAGSKCQQNTKKHDILELDGGSKEVNLKEHDKLKDRN